MKLLNHVRYLSVDSCITLMPHEISTCRLWII